MSLRIKLSVAIFSISLILVVSGVISLYEYNRVGLSSSEFTKEISSASAESAGYSLTLDSLRLMLEPQTMVMEGDTLVRIDSLATMAALPVLETLTNDLDSLSSGIGSISEDYSSLLRSMFYRSIIPGVVSVTVGLILVLMLFFFMMVYYINPLYRMLGELKNYRSFNKKYTCTFEGDDQLAELNSKIGDLVTENQQLRKRITDMRNKMD